MHPSFNRGANFTAVLLCWPGLIGSTNVSRTVAARSRTRADDIWPYVQGSIFPALGPVRRHPLRRPAGHRS